MSYNICTVTDDSYYLGTMVMLESLALTTPESIGSQVFILHDREDLENVNKENLISKFKDKFKIIFTTSNMYQEIKEKEYEFVKNIYYQNGWKFSVTLQAFLPDAIQNKSIDKVIYIDSDTIFYRNAKRFLDTKLSRPIAAQLDPGVGTQSENPTTPYFNAGVYITSLKYWNENNLLSQFSISKKSIFHAQDFLNKIFYNNWQLLGPQINVSRERLGIENIVSDLENLKNRENFIYHKKPILVHFLGQPKPWHAGYLETSKENWRMCGKIIWIDKYYQQVLDKVLENR